MTYEELGKTPEELAEILDKDNRLISEYDAENKQLKQSLDNIRQAAKNVHDAVMELDSLICL